MSTRRCLLTLGLVVVASFAVRLAALRVWGIGAIEGDGTQYARVAENLRKGLGYVGIGDQGLELNTPPLFPFLICAASFVTGSYEQAARFVSLVLGALLPLAVFGIALRLFNRRVALVAAALTILHPLLVNLSLAVLPEGIYTSLLLSAVYFVLCALDRPAIGNWTLAGLAFGLAYLVRPEAIAPLLIAALFAITATEGKLDVRCKRAVAALAMFAVLALPEVLFVFRETGKFVFSAKSAIVFVGSARLLAAQGDPEFAHLALVRHEDVPTSLPNVESWQPWQEKWASNAINSNLQGTGIWMRSNAEVIQETQIPIKELLHIIAKAARRNAPAFLEQLSSKWLGSPLIPALALLGALRRPWRKPVASSRLFVLLVPLTSVVATFSVLWSYPRFYFVIVPFLLIWAANGLVEIGLWIRASGAGAGWGWLRPAIFSYMVPGLIGLLAVIYPLNGVRALYEFKQSSPSSQIEKDVGLWIGQQQAEAGQVKIMDLSLPLAYYAHAKSLAFPYCNPEMALRYLDVAAVDYVVLHRGEKYTHYYESWLTNGIPDPRAELVHLSLGANTSQFVIYRWHRADGYLSQSTTFTK